MRNRRKGRLLAALGGMCLALTASTVPVHGQVGDDPFTGATIVTSTAGTAQPAAMFDGSAADPGSVTFFPDVGAGSEAEVVFDTAPVALSGIRLHAASDGADFSFRRSMSRFQFFADSNGDGILALSERIVDQAISTDYDSGQIGDLDSAPNEIEFAFAFPATTAPRWRVVVTQGVGIGEFEGVRVQEVDAVAAPAATTLVADPPVQGLFTLRARLTQSVSGAPIPGATLVMATSAGTICQAVTDVNGAASCGGGGAVLQIIAENGYTASFGGTSLFLPSSARAELLVGGSGTSVTVVPASPPSTDPPVTTPPPAVGMLASTGDVRGVEEWGLALVLGGLAGIAGLSSRRRRAN